jgi:Uncharacterized protein conserved in bacteria
LFIFFYKIGVESEVLNMAHNEYYTYDQGFVNGQISMNVCVFDTIVKETVKKLEKVNLDTSKGFSLAGTKTMVSCSIKDNDVYIEIHVRIQYGVNVSKTTKEIQKNISTAICEMTGVEVNHINIIVDDIDFD